MTKAEIVEQISQKTEIPQKIVSLIIEQLMLEVKSSLVNNEPVYLRGFGSFIIKRRSLKNFHAAPGKWIVIPEHNEPSFKPCKEFKEQVR